MDSVTLPPDLDRFATEAVAAGRFRDKAELVAAGVALLRQQDALRTGLLASVHAAEADSERDGWLSAEDVFARIDARLAGRTPGAA